MGIVQKLKNKLTDAHIEWNNPISELMKPKSIPVQLHNIPTNKWAKLVRGPKMSKPTDPGFM